MSIKWLLHARHWVYEEQHSSPCSQQPGGVWVTEIRKVCFRQARFIQKEVSSDLTPPGWSFKRIQCYHNLFFPRNRAKIIKGFSSVQFSSSVVLTLCNPMNHSTPGLPVHHQLLEFTQTHVHRGSDAIQPSHPLLSPSPPAPNPSQHQGLFQWV